MVIGLNGTPRVGGNSEILLDKALEGASQIGAVVVRLDVGRMNIAGCKACGSCSEDAGVCVQNDDMTRIYHLLDEADGIIVSSPLYFSGLSSQIKAVIDRCQCIWVSGHYRKGRPGAFICVGGDEGANFRNAVSEARSFMKGIGFEGRAELLVPGLDKRGAVIGMPELLQKAQVLGRELALQC
jgi:multimeric flavodoxin WrbA